MQCWPSSREEETGSNMWEETLEIFVDVQKVLHSIDNTIHCYLKRCVAVIALSQSWKGLSGKEPCQSKISSKVSCKEKSVDSAQCSELARGIILPWIYI